MAVNGRAPLPMARRRSRGVPAAPSGGGGPFRPWRRYGVLLACGAAAIAAALIWRAVTEGGRPLAEHRAAADTLALQLATLPDDPKQAERALRDAQRALARLQPSGPYIVIDSHANLVMLRSGGTVLLEGVCSTGSGAALVDSATGRTWVFNTPRGVFKINSKLKNPWWRKPDWAFIEENEEIPKDERLRYDENMMGDYAMGFGDGYFIHGTIYERLLGISVTHGCVRLGAEDLKALYDRVKIGTPVYIF